MAAKRKTTRKLIFKRANFTDVTGNASLQTLLDSALSKCPLALDRGETSEDDPEEDDEVTTRLINFHKEYRGLRCCEVFDFTKGQVMATAEVKPDATVLNIDAVAPQGDKTEFISGVLYFAVSGNLVIISQSASIQAKALESHLNWLLHEHGGLRDEQRLMLCDEVPKDLAKSVEAGGTKSIIFNSAVQIETTEKSEVEVDGKGTAVSETLLDQVKNVKYSLKGVALDAIESLFPEGLKLPSELDPSQLSMDRELKVDLKLSWVRPRKDDSTDVLDIISNQLRHVDEEVDWKVTTSAGILTKDEMKLQKSVGAILKDNGLISRKDFWPQMVDWLQELLESERVEPNA